MKLQYPDYNKSIMNLANSILKHYGVEPYHSTLKELDAYLDKDFRNVVVLVLDGMGVYNIKKTLDEGSFLSSHMVAELSSTVPSTTTAATTTLQTGLSPAEHGWLGWSLYFPEVEDNVDIFSNSNSRGEKAAAYHLAKTYMPFNGIVERLMKRGLDAHSVSPFGTDPVESIQEMAGTILDICNQEGKSYIYAYWPEPDHTMHETGTGSLQTREWMEQSDDLLEKLCHSLSDTLLVITADHGHVDMEPELLLLQPALVETLKHMPSIEPRCAAFEVKEGMESKFEEAFLNAYGEDFLLFNKQQVLDKQLFGPGAAHERFEGFIGDYLAVSVSPKTIFDTPEKCQLYIGAHAGLTGEEMTVPLIVAMCRKKR